MTGCSDSFSVFIITNCAYTSFFTLFGAGRFFYNGVCAFLYGVGQTGNDLLVEYLVAASAYGDCFALRTARNGAYSASHCTV